MPISVYLPYNKTFKITVTTNAGWVQRALIIDAQTSAVYGPYEGHGESRLIGTVDFLRTAGNNPNGYKINIQLSSRRDDGTWHENTYKIFPTGSAANYLSVGSEDGWPGPGGNDDNDCMVHFAIVG